MSGADRPGALLMTYGSPASLDREDIRAYLARARIKTDMCQALLDDTLAAIAASRADVMLRVLEVKAAAGEAALEVDLHTRNSM